METQYQYVRIEKVGKVAHLTLNRPDILNAVHQAAAIEVAAAAHALAADPAIRLIAIRGAGRAFCTGIDLKALAADGIDMRYFRIWEDALRCFETMDKLVLCMIHGHAVGGGLQLAMACDIRVATADANLSVPAVNEGLIPGLGTFRLARFIGHGRAKRMILSGDPVTGAEALKIGLVDHLVSAAGMATEFNALIEKYMGVNSEGCRLSKLAVNECFDLRFEPFLERYMGLQEQAFASKDFNEAMTAYRAKRAPVWR
ncbi:MAG: putative enoyl-CoA hydratase echA8 [Alphaproteobacteria bacterium MarineAlpha10_Bin3]|nr:MAG: putative enoyl-CoA hydratase echA8 [Alphaproteobacteria bacterium MarineAlpha10_Bin3]PPR75475.1 MAG: putative enoyl-CoA hydratase echA8 [Alphaproteobacteria bacterium MarineAlpha4_Bin1]